MAPFLMVAYMKIISWLKPNFSAHWGNWVLAPVLAFFLGFFPTLVLSAEYKWSYIGHHADTPISVLYLWLDSQSGMLGSFAGSRRYANSFQDHQCTEVSESSYQCSARLRFTDSSWPSYHPRHIGYTTFDINPSRSSCSESEKSDPSSPCFHVEPEDCPDPDSEATTRFHRVDSTARWPSEGIFNGCSVYLDRKDIMSKDGVDYVWYYYNYTGGDTVDEQAPNMEPTDSDPLITDEPDPDPESDPDPIGPSPETSETVYNGKTTETLPDGTTVDVESETTTTTRGAGTDKVVTEVQTVFKRSDGISKTETITTTEITNPDGSKTVTTETQYSYTQHGDEYTVIDHETGAVSHTKGDNISAGGTVTKTDTYDADGNKTGSSTSCSSSGDDGLGEEAEEQNFCAENPQNVVCKEWDNGTGSDETFAIDDQRTKVDQAWQELNTLISDTQEEIKQVFDTSELGGASLGCYDFFSAFGTSYDVCLDQYSQAFSYVGQGLLFLTVLLVLYMLLKD